MDTEGQDYRDLLARWGQQETDPVREPMRGRRKAPDNPSRDDLRLRRRNRRTATPGGDVQTRAELVRALSKAASLAEQARILDEITSLDSKLRTTAAQSRELDFASDIVEQTFTPVRVYEHHTAATDWMGYEEAVPRDWQNRVVAEAATWYSKVPDFVRADGEEFAIQAEGKARQYAGRFGIQAEAARQTFTQYAGFLRTQGASGLDQIQQTVDPHDNPKPTPLNPEVFDTFAPEVDPVNAGVSGTEDSNRAPLIQEIVGGGSGMDQGAPEKPSEHDEDDTLSWAPPRTAALIERPTMAIGGYGYSLDDFRREAGGPGKAEGGRAAAPVRTAATATCKDCHCALSKENRGPRGRCLNCQGRKGGKAAAKTAASGLDQIQQTVDPHDNPKPTPLPGEVAFPLDDEFQEQWSTNGGDVAQPVRTAAHRCADCQGSIRAGKCSACGKGCACKGCAGKAASRRKVADMFGNSDEPHAVPQPNVANNPATTPQRPNGSAASGRSDGASDAQLGNAPSFADDSSSVDPYVPGYAQGYDGADQRASLPQDVPPSMRTSALIVTASEREQPDFRKGYGYGSRWTPRSPLVAHGSAEFEAGVYAGISDNPAQQRAFVAAHRAAEAQHPALGVRVAQHKRLTLRIASKNEVPTNGLYLHASTSLDLDTLAPNSAPAPDGSTPINGPGRPGPLDGVQNASAPGGPAPYNGAEPFGTPVVPTALQGPPNPADALVGGGGMSTSNQVMSFRRRVQAGLLAERKQEKRAGR